MRHTIVIAWLLTATTAAAQDRALPLSLDEAVTRALATSHRLAEAAARGDASDAVTAERRASRLPQINAQAGYTRTNHVDVFGLQLPGAPLRVIYPDIPDNYRTRLDLQWPIYTAGRLDALERAANAEARAVAGDLAAARNDLKLEVTRAYWAVVTATESLRVIEESLRRVRAHLEDVRNQLTAGLVVPSDVLRVQAQASRQQMLVAQAQATREVAEAELGRLVGADPGTSVQPIAPFNPPTPPAAGVDAMVHLAREGRVEREALLNRAAAADQRTRAALAGLRPTIAVGGGVDYARPNPRIFPRTEAWNESWDASVSVTWPLFDGGRSRAEVAETRASARAVQERLAEFDSTLAADVRQRLSELRASRAVIAAAEDEIASAEEARRVIADRFEAGVATSTDLLDAQVAVLQAHLDRTQAIATAQLADARLARVLGR